MTELELVCVSCRRLALLLNLVANLHNCIHRALHLNFVENHTICALSLQVSANHTATKISSATTTPESYETHISSNTNDDKHAAKLRPRC